MKQYLVLLLCAFMCFCACSGEDIIPDEPDTPVPDNVELLTIPSTENLAPSFSTDGGNATVSFTANANWTAKVTDDAATWCTVSPSSGGSGSHTITITTAANDTPDNRTVTVLLAADTVTQAINITQKQKDALTVTSGKFEVPKEGGTVEIEAKANVMLDYKISDEGKSWITLIGTRAMNTSYLTFKIAANVSAVKREASIILAGGNLSEVVTVVQEAAEPAEFVLSSTEIEMEAEQGTFEIAVSSDIDYDVTSQVDWIKEITGKAVSTKVHKFEVSTNASTQARKGVLVFCTAQQVCVPVTVNQKGMVELSVSQSEYNVNEEGGTIVVAVTGKVDQMSISKDWIKQDSVLDGVYKFVISENAGTDVRSAEITFKNEALASEVKVKVFQACVDVFSVSKNTVEVGYDRNTFEISISANMGYEIKPQVNWIKEIATKGVTTKVHVFEVSENESQEAREGIVVVCNDAQVCIPVIVKQKGVDKDWVEKEFFHRSLGMRFTADWCGYCPMMATAFDEARKQLSDKLEVLSLHADGNLYAAVSRELANQYGITGYPTAYVDGINRISNYTSTSYTASIIVSAVEDMEADYETVTGASWKSTIAGNRISLKLKAYLKKSGSYKVTALLVEDNIVGYQNGESDNYVHNDVVRTSFTAASGDKITASEDGQVKTLDYSLDMLESWNKANMRIVVYIQAQDSNGLWYVNNSVSALVGKDQQLMLVSGNSGGIEGIVPGNKITF